LARFITVSTEATRIFVTLRGRARRICLLYVAIGHSASENVEEDQQRVTFFQIFLFMDTRQENKIKITEDLLQQSKNYNCIIITFISSIITSKSKIVVVNKYYSLRFVSFSVCVCMCLFLLFQDPLPVSTKAYISGHM